MSAQRVEHRLRVLRAAAALGHFTVRKLAAFAGVSVAIAEAVLAREPALFIPPTYAGTGSTYRIVARAMRKELGEPCLEDQLPVVLAAGYDTLLRRIPGSTSRAQRAELRIDARMALELAKQEWPNAAIGAQSELDRHERCFTVLNRIATLEDDPLTDVPSWRETCTELCVLVEEMQMQEDHALAAAIALRMIASPMQPRVLDLAELVRPQHMRHPPRSNTESNMLRDLRQAAG